MCDLRIYVSSGAENVTYVKAILDYFCQRSSLAGDGLLFVAPWADEWKDKVPYLESEDKGRLVLGDIHCIDTCDAILSVYPGGTGSSAELSYAISRGLAVVYCIDPAFLDDALWPTWAFSAANTLQDPVKNLLKARSTGVAVADRFTLGVRVDTLEEAYNLFASFQERLDLTI